MRIHSNIVRADKVRDALGEQKALGRIAPHVGFKYLMEHGSRSHDFAVEIQLEAFVRDCGRRAGNSGSYGAMRPEYDGYAATYDEWGWLLAALYAIDPDMIVGTPKSPVYRGALEFQDRTALTYNPAKLIELIEDDGVDPYPWVVGKAATTKRGFYIGRRGAGRVAAQRSYWPGKWMPRSIDEVQQFAFPLTQELKP